MLAKVWKKVLFAICIIACIYNVMSKIVNRHSLEENLKKANDGNVVFDLSSKEKNGNTTSIQTTNDVYINEVTENSSTQNEIVVETNEVENNSQQTRTTNFFNFDFLH